MQLSFCFRLQFKIQHVYTATFSSRSDRGYCRNYVELRLGSHYYVALPHNQDKLIHFLLECIIGECTANPVLRWIQECEGFGRILVTYHLYLTGTSE